MVSLLGDFDFDFPDGFKLEKTMKDFLEPEVDEKYYINTDKARKLVENLISQNTNADKESISLTLFKPIRISIANCISAHERGISSRRKEGSGVLELRKD